MENFVSGYLQNLFNYAVDKPELFDPCENIKFYNEINKKGWIIIKKNYAINMSRIWNLSEIFFVKNWSLKK